MRYSILALLMFVAPFSSPAFGLEVVATLPDLAKIAEAVGGDRVHVTAITSAVQDPHFVDPKPSFVVKLRDADVFLISGLELEIGWVPPLLDGARNPKINAGAPGYVDCSRGIPVIERPTGEVTRAMGDAHPLGNPHYLLDPLNGVIVARTIAEALGKADPAGAADYAARSKAFGRTISEGMFGKALVDEVGESKLDRLARSGELDAFVAKGGVALGGWMGKMRPFAGKKIVFYHRSFSYFAERFGLVVADYVELKPGIQPGPSHLADLITKMKKEGIKVVGTHAFYDEKVANLVAAKAGAKLLVVPLASTGSSYAQLFDTLTGQFATAL